MSRAWWRAPGGAVAAVMTVAVAATGCAAKVQGNTGPLPSSPSVATTVATSTPGPAAAPLAASSGDPAGVLFCTDGKADPATLRYFTSLHLRVMGLPASASQAQTVAAICADLQHTGGGAEYSAYLLAANRKHWFFTGIAKVHGKLSDLCHKASPSPSPSS